LEERVELLKNIFKNNILQMKMLKINEKGIFYEISKTSLYQNNRLEGKLKTFMITYDQKMKALINNPSQMFIVFVKDRDKDLNIIFIKGEKLLKKLKYLKIEFKI
jgi:hypothetical protein